MIPPYLKKYEVSVIIRAIEQPEPHALENRDRVVAAKCTDIQVVHFEFHRANLEDGKRMVRDVTLNALHRIVPTITAELLQDIKS